MLVRRHVLAAGIPLLLCVVLTTDCSDGTGIKPPPPASLVLRFQTAPSGAGLGAPLRVQPVVAVVDSLSGLVRDTAVTITARLAGGLDGLTGTLIVQTVNGVAQFTDLRLSGKYGSRTLVFETPGLPAVTSQLNVMPPARSLLDRPDDVAGPQVHVVYALPLESVDRGLDTKYDIAYSVDAFEQWLASTTGLQIPLDLYQGSLDVSFLQIDRSDAEMRVFGSGLSVEIERQLAATGTMQPDKRYIIYYDGTSNTGRCGGAAWPPIAPGQSASLFLRACPAELVNEPNASPGYWEFAALHDLIHTFGIVSQEAPHFVASSPGHVPEPQDLLYGGGSDPWSPTVVDVNNDDYFAPSLPGGLANLAGSPFVTPVLKPAPPRAAGVAAPHPVFPSSWLTHQPFPEDP